MWKLISKCNIVLYRLSGGRLAGSWKGIPIGLLTTIGRRSGEPRTVPLLVFEDEDRYVVIASSGGSPKNPPWYLNLQANPEVTLEIHGEKKHLIAGTAAGEERQRLFGQAVSRYGAYAEMQASVQRDIPVVILRQPHTDAVT